MFAPVRTRRTFEEAVQQIVEAIKLGDLHIGDRLPPERDLAMQMGISRPTLREAIKVLSDSGVIEVRRGSGGGMFVCSDAIPMHLLWEREQLRLSEVSSVLEARRLLEPRVAQLAAVYGSDDDFEAMRKIIELQREFVHDRVRSLLLDHRFHTSIARATKNPMVMKMMHILLAQLEIARDMALRGSHEPETAISIHEHTLRAIMSRDPAKVEDAMDEHLSFLEEIWEAETGRARLRAIPEFMRTRVRSPSTGEMRAIE